MNKKLYEPTIAFAGIFQVATLVRDLSKLGRMDEEAFTASINSIYKIDAKNTEEVFGGLSHLTLGFKKLIEILDYTNLNPDAEISTYVISLLHLERKLSRASEVYSLLSHRLKYAVSQAQYTSPTDPQLISTLADIYLKTVGTLPFRIKILGNPVYLTSTDTIDKVRALLLAGIRSAVLWQQIGGSRWHLLFSRGKMVKVAREILNIIDNNQKPYIPE